MNERVKEIFELMTETIKAPANLAFTRWQKDGTSDADRKAEMVALITIGTDRIVREMVTYGDDEICEACKAIYAKMSVEECDEVILGIIQDSRDEYAHSLDRVLLSEDGGAGYIQASERYLKNRLDEVKSLSMDNAFLFGVDDIDYETGGVQPGEICVIAGAQGSMKTSFVLSGLERALANGQTVLFASLDMSPGELQERRILRRTGFSQQAYQHFLATGDDAEIKTATADIVRADKGHLTLVGNDGSSTGLTADALADMICRQRPCVVIVDYLTLLRGRKQSDLECVNEAMPLLKYATQQSKCRTVLLSQMGRASKSEQSAGKVGGHSKGGGIVEELAHMEIELFKDLGDDPYSPQIVASITKNRRGASGMSFSLDVEAHCMKFLGTSTQVWRDNVKLNKAVFVKTKPTAA